MAEHSIPVDLFNPGQVFACMGLLELADMLLGNATGGFDWTEGDNNARFNLRAAGDENPVANVVEYLAEAKVDPLAPTSWSPGKNPKSQGARNKLQSELREMQRVTEFPTRSPATASALPVQLNAGGNRPNIMIGHWADDSAGRNSFKLYAGNRSAAAIAEAMLKGVREKPRKNQSEGELKTFGIQTLWEKWPSELVERPFDVLTPIGGSFNFDPRGAWTSIDVGYSPNDQKHLVAASPLVEILAAIGLENTRPQERHGREVHYAAWGTELPPILARAALAGTIKSLPLRFYRFNLHTSGKNKVVTFAQEEI